jgi:hypothetical protein
MNAMTTLNHIRARPAQILIALISSLLITTFLFAQTPVAPTVPTTDVTASEPAKASEPAPAGLPLPRLFNYTLGFALINSPTYLGASDTRFKVRPFFAVQYGRFSIADSRATAITDFGVGASYALLDQPTWKASVGLRVDNGRKSGDSANPCAVAFPPRGRRYRGGRCLPLRKRICWGAKAAPCSRSARRTRCRLMSGSACRFQRARRLAMRPT